MSEPRSPESEPVPPVARWSEPPPAPRRKDRPWAELIAALSFGALAVAAVEGHRAGSHAAAEPAVPEERPLIVTDTVRTPAGGAATPAGGRIVIPRSAVFQTSGGPAVFVQDRAGRFVATPVRLGAREGTAQEVSAGVRPGEIIVVDGVAPLREELLQADTRSGLPTL